jgi:hypothetical protein
MDEGNTIQRPIRRNIPSVVAALCTSVFSIMTLLMWHGTLNLDADNIVSVLSLSFIGIVAAAFGIRRTGGRAVAAVCLVISSLFFLGLMSIILLLFLTPFKMGQ